jgi:DNA-3-methyladenine glycosylase I
MPGRAGEEDDVEAPERIEPRGLADYLEVMSKSVFQTGISWRVVESKWPALKEAFRGFDVPTIASFGQAEIDALATDPRVIRNRRKIEATVENARRMLDLEDQYGAFRDYLRSHGSFDATVADLRKKFKFLGEMGCYHFLWVVNEEVPSYEEWCASHHRQPMQAAG